LPEKKLRIGELAAELGLNPKTIRYYEQIGLLPAVPRTESGYRLYGAADIERLRFIGKAKAVGLSLEEIGEILALRREGRAPCEHVLELLNRKLAAVDRQLRALRDFRRELLGLREEAARTATAEACVCGIIEHHEPGERAEPVWRPLTAATTPAR
jgi:MerR family Zn(II)-responsive transcriptional regulator of zntA